MVKCEETYSFHLSADESTIYSDTGSISSSYKARIDSLFKNKRQIQSVIPPKTLVTTVEVHNADNRHNLVMTSNQSKLNAEAKTTNVTSIRVPSPQAWKAKLPTPKEELENIFGGPDKRQRAFNDTRTAVQAQIEKLFADASADQPAIPGVRVLSPKAMPAPAPPPISLAPSPPPLPKNPPPPLPSHIMRMPIPSPPPPNGESSSTESPVSDRRSISSASPIPKNSDETHISKSPNVSSNMKYGVDYLGAIQMPENATSLDLLQGPLKELYYKYRCHIFRGRKPIPGAIHITEKGFKIMHGTKDMPGHYELMNPFATIAVWAAVKLVIRREVGEHGQMFFSYAFLPLICDPEAQDKYNLYHELNVPNPNVMAGDHPPMFACVMRKVGVSKVLECHGFVCGSPEDAIVIAANLYQSLLESMRKESSSDSSDGREDKMSGMFSDGENTPVRPPRKKKSRNSDSFDSNRRLRRSSSEDFLSFNTSTNNRISKRRIKRSISDRHSFSALEDNECYSKIPLPRSKSFVEVSQAYNVKELLHDVKKETGFTSVDDILKQIVTPRGMSFSEMNPSYREILLKLAYTVSKDEMYQRSKNILRKYKCRTTSIASIADSDSDASTISTVLKATKRSFSRLGSRASSLHNNPGTKNKNAFKMSVFNKNEHNNKLNRIEFSPQENKQTKMALPVQPKLMAPKTPMVKRINKQNSDGFNSCSECGYESECSSKCYCSLPRPKSNSRIPIISNTLTREKPRKKLSSHCDCDTESCVESEKCYCSLKSFKVNAKNNSVCDSSLDSGTNTDTDTTIKTKISANRGYGSELSSVCNSQRNYTSVSTEHSKSRSAGTILSLHPDRIRRKSLSSNFSSDSDNSEKLTGSSRATSRSRMSFLRQRSSSTEFLDQQRLRRHPSGSIGSGGSRDSPDSNDFSMSRRSSVDCLIDYDSRRSRSSNGSQRKILLVSAVDPSGKVVYRGASQRAKHEASDTASILSMKKTAEIAALFSELKLNQTTDFLDNSRIRNNQDSSSDSGDEMSSASLRANGPFLFSDGIEDTLGYLP